MNSVTKTRIENGKDRVFVAGCRAKTRENSRGVSFAVEASENSGFGGLGESRPIHGRGEGTAHNGDPSYLREGGGNRSHAGSRRTQVLAFCIASRWCDQDAGGTDQRGGSNEYWR